MRVFFFSSQKRDHHHLHSCLFFGSFDWKLSTLKNKKQQMGKEKVFFMLLMKEAIVTVNIKIIICEMPSSFRNRQHSIIYSPPVPTNTFYCCCFHLFIFFRLVAVSFKFFLRAPVHHQPFLPFALFFLFMNEAKYWFSHDFVIILSSSIFYIFFSLLCYSFFTHHFSPYFFMNQYFVSRECEYPGKDDEKIHTKMLSVIGKFFFYKTLNKRKGEGCGKNQCSA